MPTTDIFAQGDDLVIRVELAGVDPADVELRFANGVLTVSGNRDPEFGDGGDEPKFYVRERFYGEFRRSITLPEGTRQKQIQAAFDDGLVEIVVAGAVQQAGSTRIELRDRSTGATRRSLRHNRALAGALTGITAAVVGVIAHLAVYFAVNTLFAATRTLDWGPLALQLPDPATLRPVPLAIGVVAAVLLFAARWPVLRVLGVAALLGLVAGLVGLPVT